MADTDTVNKAEYLVHDRITAGNMNQLTKMHCLQT